MGQNDDHIGQEDADAATVKGGGIRAPLHSLPMKARDTLVPGTKPFLFIQ